MFRSFSSCFAGLNFSGSVKLGDRIDCFKRSVHCRLKLAFTGPSTPSVQYKFSKCAKTSLSGASAVSSAKVVPPSVGGAPESLTSCFSRSPTAQLGEEDMLAVWELGSDIRHRKRKAYAGHQTVRNGTSRIIARYPNCSAQTRLSSRGGSRKPWWLGVPRREGGCVRLACYF